MSYSERKNIREQRTTLFCAFISSWLSGELLRDDEFCLAGHEIQHTLRDEFVRQHEVRVDSEYLVREEGEQGGVSVPRAQQDDDSSGFGSGREGVGLKVCPPSARAPEDS